MPVGSHAVMGLGTPVKLDLATATTSDRVPDGTTELAASAGGPRRAGRLVTGSGRGVDRGLDDLDDRVRSRDER